MKNFLANFALGLGLYGLSPWLIAGAPPFSYMTLNGTSQVAVAVEDIDRAFEVYGLDTAKVLNQVTTKLTTGGLGVVSYPEAVSGPGVGLLRVRILTNHDAHGFYHLSVKLELRQKIPLGNTAGGFVSEAVWTDAGNAVMMASEIEKVTALVDELIANFIAEYHRQNGTDNANP
ncbi:MAG: hypothetical protein EXR86_08980 [Gammaproteobacteria bacterium]|nr:hypothetical protein [Gammaproteobacteria bacterium]